MSFGKSSRGTDITFKSGVRISICGLFLFLRTRKHNARNLRVRHSRVGRDSYRQPPDRRLNRPSPISDSRLGDYYRRMHRQPAGIRLWCSSVGKLFELDLARQSLLFCLACLVPSASLPLWPRRWPLFARGPESKTRSSEQAHNLRGDHTHGQEALCWEYELRRR